MLCYDTWYRRAAWEGQPFPPQPPGKLPKNNSVLHSWRSILPKDILEGSCYDGQICSYCRRRPGDLRTMDQALATCWLAGPDCRGRRTGRGNTQAAIAKRCHPGCYVSQSNERLGFVSEAPLDSRYSKVTRICRLNPG